MRLGGGSLVRGTAQAFELFRETPDVHPAVGPQSLRDRQRVGRGWAFDRPHVPKCARAEVNKGAAVQGCEVFFDARQIAHGNLFLP